MLYKNILRPATFIIILLFIFITGSFSQGYQNPIGTIAGTLIDSTTNAPVDYASVALHRFNDKKLITGTLSRTGGKFLIESVNPGKYYLQITFMGYDPVTTDNFLIDRNNINIDIGKILMHRSVTNLKEVVVQGDAPAIDYQIDKKVINVSKQLTSISGTAVDVLENVPSIRVDIEGNVLLRGSSGFTVLIDGRPSVLDPNDALQQIPASTIDNIEIITNPSVKFDPDGTAGIINIVTKKNKMQGISGIANLNAGLDNKYGADFLLNLKHRKFNYYLGGNYNVSEYPGTMESERRTNSGDSTFYVNSQGTHDRKRNMKGLRAGVEFHVDDKNFISLGGRFGRYEGGGDSKLDFKEWTKPGSDVSQYNNHEESDRGGNFYSLTTNYERKFNKDGHKLLAEVTIDSRDMKEKSITELSTLSGELTDGKKNIENGPGRRLRMKVDYTLPLGENDKLEAGYQSRISNSEDNTEYHILDLVTQQYVIQPEYSHRTKYSRNIHSLYTLYAGKIKDFGYQGGLRGEYTWRQITSSGESEKPTIDRWDLFPTIHMSYDLPADNQVMGSYTRRIERPRGWYLEPFLTWSDAYNVRQGNPNLQPEYIDSYELSYIKKFGKDFISFESYYRITHNKIERVRTVYSENVMLSTIKNVGQDYSLGIECMFSFQLYKWWDADLLGNYYRYKVEGVLYDEDFSNESNNWSARFNNTFNIKKNTKIQLNSNYDGPSVTAQGTEEAHFMLNAAVRQDFYDKKFSAVLQLRDVLATAVHEHTSEGPDFYSWDKHSHKAPVVTLSLSYRFNNYRPDRKSINGDRNDMNGDEGGGEF